MMGKQVQELVNELEQVYPIGISFEVIHFSPQEVADKVNEFVSNLIQAVLVVAAVMLLSLGLRTCTQLELV